MLSLSLDNPNLILSQVIQSAGQAVNLPVSGFNLEFEDGRGLGRLGVLLLQVQHPLDQGNHLVVVGLIRGIVEVDGAHGELFYLFYSSVLAQLGLLGPQDFRDLRQCLHGIRWCLPRAAAYPRGRAPEFHIPTSSDYHIICGTPERTGDRLSQCAFAVVSGGSKTDHRRAFLTFL